MRATYRLFLSIMIACFMWLNVSATSEAAAILCQKNQAPSLIKPMADWDIIATNTASIATATAFQGKNITYFIFARPKNSKNKIMIDHQSGRVTIKAEHKDNFDVKVTAKNPCGVAYTKFNVKIDEEE